MIPIKQFWFIGIFIFSKKNISTINYITIIALGEQTIISHTTANEITENTILK